MFCMIYIQVRFNFFFLIKADVYFVLCLIGTLMVKSLCYLPGHIAQSVTHLTHEPEVPG